MSELNGTRPNTYTFDVPLRQGYTVQTLLMMEQSKHAPCAVEYVPSENEAPSMIRVTKRYDMQRTLVPSSYEDIQNEKYDEDDFFYQSEPFDIASSED